MGDHHGRTAKEQPSWSEPWTRFSSALTCGFSVRRACLSRAERGAVQVAAVAVAGFCIYGFATGSPSTVGYGSSVIVTGQVSRPPQGRSQWPLTAFSRVGSNAAGSVARGVVFLSRCSCCRALSRRIRT